MIDKILIANRGEIVRRVILACHELGITAVAVYSDADRNAPWVALADEAYHLPGMTAGETYLNQEKILAIAQQCEAAALHPGYGFLSENPDFAEACHDAGLIFIGPSAAAMRQLGSKATARRLAQQAGVPIVPGVDGADLDEAALAAAAAQISFPVLVKASAGGGGKGMRVVWEEAALLDALQAARREARSAFGDDHLLLEKYFTEIHHVEIQILADQQGHVLHLYERECSIQRRHQKIIEESPAPVIIDNDLRRRMAQAAVLLARAANYSNAGTVEFIVDPEGNFYFLEMNTRLQVEHPVTELVTGIDLVTWQIRIANGERLTITQEAISQRGHAIECRVYAEDPAQQFLPSTGTIQHYQRPSGPGIRVDDGIAAGVEITPYYDPMLAKVITWGLDRAEAIQKMKRALAETIILGITTNIPYLQSILAETQFQAGNTSTTFLDDQFVDWQPEENLTEEQWLAAAVFELLAGAGQSSKQSTPVAGEQTDQNPWNIVSSWRNVRLDLMD